MAFDFSLLEQIVVVDSAGDLKIDATRFGSTEIEDLLDTFFPDGIFTAKGVEAQSDPTKKIITLTKGTVFPGATSFHIDKAYINDSIFYIDDEGDVQMSLKLILQNPEWTFSQSFPGLKGTVFDGMDYVGQYFQIDSAPKEELKPDFRQSFGYPTDSPLPSERLIKGLSFYSQIAIKDPQIKNLTSFFPQPNGEAAVILAGPIEVLKSTTDSKDLHPQLLLSTTQTHSSNIGQYYQLEYNLQLASLFYEFVADGSGDKNAVLPNGVMALRTTLKSSKNPDLAIPLAAMIYNAPTDIVSYKMGKAPSGSFQKDQMGQLLDGEEVKTNLNPDGSSALDFDLFSLEFLNFQLQSNPLKLWGIDIAFLINNTESWSPWPNLVTLDELGFQISMSWAEAEVKEAVSLYGEATFGSSTTKLDAFVQLPSQQIVISLDDLELHEKKEDEDNTDKSDSPEKPKSVDLTQVINDHTDDSVEMDKMTGQSFRFSGDIKEKNYSFEAAIVEDWTLWGTGEDALILENIYINISSTAGVNAASMFAGLSLAGGKFGLSAEWQKNEGWTFVGETDPGTAINLTEIVEATGLPLPVGFPEVQLEQVNLEIKKGPKEKGISLSGELLAEGIEIDLSDLSILGHETEVGSKISIDSISFDFKKIDSSITLSLLLGTLDSLELSIPIGKQSKEDDSNDESGQHGGGSGSGGGIPKNTAKRQLTYPNPGSGVWIDVTLLWQVQH